MSSCLPAEAGEGEDGRIKSAIGIGSLLLDGLGDTIRVSLTEDSPYEIPVCRELIEQIPVLSNRSVPIDSIAPSFDPFTFERRRALELPLAPKIDCGGQQSVRVV